MPVQRPLEKKAQKKNIKTSPPSPSKTADARLARKQKTMQRQHNRFVSSWPAKFATHSEQPLLELNDDVRNKNVVLPSEPRDLRDSFALHKRHHVCSKGGRHVAHYLLFVERYPVVLTVQGKPGTGREGNEGDAL